MSKIRNTDTLTNQLVYANLRSGIYSLTLVDDSTGCTFISPVQIDTNLPLKAFATTLRVPACYRDQELVFQIDSIKNGNPAYQISALNADTGYRAINFAQAVSNISSAPIRTFFVEDGNGCKTAITFNLPVRDSLQVSVNIASRSECFSPTGKLRFTSAEGGTGSIKLLITNLNRQVTDTLLVLPADSMLNNLEAGAYLITIQDSLGCSKSVSITVPGNSPRASQLVIKNACPGQSNGSIQLSGLTGGTKPFDFELTRADGFQRIQRDSLFGSLSTGIYTITISDSSQPQCRSVYTREVKFIDSLKINVVAFKPSSCSNYDGEVRFTIIGGLAQYQYSIDSTVNTYTPFRTLIADTVAINGLSARSIGQLHTIKVIDASPNGGCTAQLSFQMPGNTPLTYEYELKNVNCFGDSTGQLQLFNLQGTGPLIIEAYRTGTGELIASDSIRMAYFNNDQFNASGLPAGMYNMQVRQ